MGAFLGDISSLSSGIGSGVADVVSAVEAPQIAQTYEQGAIESAYLGAQTPFGTIGGGSGSAIVLVVIAIGAYLLLRKK